MACSPGAFIRQCEQPTFLFAIQAMTWITNHSRIKQFKYQTSSFFRSPLYSTHQCFYGCLNTSCSMFNPLWGGGGGDEWAESQCAVLSARKLQTPNCLSWLVEIYEMPVYTAKCLKSWWPWGLQIGVPVFRFPRKLVCLRRPLSLRGT